MKSLAEVLAGLDPKDDSLWTADGLPALVPLSKIMGGEITRQQVSEAAPGLNRKAAQSGVAIAPAPAPTTDPEPKVAKPKAKEKPAEPMTIAELEADLENKTTALHAAQIAFEAAQKARDKALIEEEERDSMPDHLRNQQNIQDFLAQQQRDREARG